MKKNARIILLRIDQLYTALLFFGSWICSWFYPSQKNLWLIAERKTEAQDNGYWMFRYIVENHPEINVRYIIEKDSPDYQKLLPWKDKVVEASSFTHYMLIWKVKYAVSTHFHTYFPYRVNLQFFVIFLKRLNKQCRLVWLQHGITKDFLPGIYKNRINVDMLITGAKPEFDYFNQRYDYPSGIIKYTGFARFDQLHDVHVNKNQILFMPTWRKWLTEEGEIFKSSDFYTNYCSLLNNEALHSLLIKYNVKLIFYLHSKFQVYTHLFSELNLPENIIVADNNHYDVQQLLKDSAMLITDYSSVAFDFAYMKKPLIYFQFDEEEYRKMHYSKGYYDYRDGLGIHTTNIEGLIDALRNCIEHNFINEEKYSNKFLQYFPLHDTSNCERIYRDICKL